MCHFDFIQYILSSSGGTNWSIIDERRQQAALKEFYEREALKEHNKKRIQSLKTFTKVVNPIVCVGFVFAFWAVGLHQSFRAL